MIISPTKINETYKESFIAYKKDKYLYPICLWIGKLEEFSNTVSWEEI